MTKEEQLKALQHDIAILDEMLKVYENERKLIQQLKEDEKVALDLVAKGDLEGGVAYTNELFKELGADIKIEFIDK